MCAGLNFYPVYRQPSLSDQTAAKKFVYVPGKAKIDRTEKNRRI